MRIRTEGDFEYRRDVIEDAGSVFGTRDNTKAILKACEHAYNDHKSKREALKYLETHVPGQHARELAEILSTPQMRLEYEARATVEANGD